MRKKVYDENATLIDRTLCSNIMEDNEPTEIFRGRDFSQMRFKPGDIVEVLEIWAEMPATIKTAIITAAPPDIERCWSVMQELSGGSYPGFDDDEYCIISWNPKEASIYSYHPIYCFKPQFPVSERRRNWLNEWFKFATENPDKTHRRYPLKVFDGL